MPRPIALRVLVEAGRGALPDVEARKHVART